MKKVTYLLLYDNQLTELPRGLEKLTQLKTLELGKNKLTDVKGLEKLTKLEYLGLGFNQLTDVTGLEILTQLKTLFIPRNQLTEVPKGLEKLTQLTYLNIINNPDLTRAQLDELKKALPKCDFYANPTK